MVTQKVIMAVLMLSASTLMAEVEKLDFQAIPEVRILRGESDRSLRDVAAIYHEGVFHVYLSLVEPEADGSVFWYTAHTESRDLVHWSELKKLTPRDQNLNFSSPGNVIRFRGEWILCLQTYPIPGLITLGQKDWEWGKRGRLSAATVIDCRANPEVGKFVMFFHCTKVPEQEGMYNHCSIGIAWSDDLKTWEWPGKSPRGRAGQ